MVPWMNINVHQSRVDLRGCPSMSSALAVSVLIKTNNKILTYLKLMSSLIWNVCQLYNFFHFQSFKKIHLYSMKELEQIFQILNSYTNHI